MNQQQLKCLQLGDWVQAEGKEEPQQVTVIGNDGSIELNDEYYCTIEDLCSMWLTQDILNKNFDRDYKTWVVTDKLRVEINNYSGKQWVLTLRTEECGYPFHFVAFYAFNFVHELQNALRLLGIEKEVVL